MDRGLRETVDTVGCCATHSTSVKNLIAKKNSRVYTTNVLSKHTLRDRSSKKKEQEENRDDEQQKSTGCVDWRW